MCTDRHPPQGGQAAGFEPVEPQIHKTPPPFGVRRGARRRFLRPDKKKRPRGLAPRPGMRVLSVQSHTAGHSGSLPASESEPQSQVRVVPLRVHDNPIVPRRRAAGQEGGTAQVAKKRSGERGHAGNEIVSVAPLPRDDGDSPGRCEEAAPADAAISCRSIFGPCARFPLSRKSGLRRRDAPIIPGGFLPFRRFGATFSFLAWSNGSGTVCYAEKHGKHGTACPPQRWNAGAPVRAGTVPARAARCGPLNISRPWPRHRSEIS